MIEDVKHGHVPNNFEVLFHVDRLIQREVADVRSRVADTVARCVAKRCPKYSICLKTIHDKPDIVLGHGLFEGGISRTETCHVESDVYSVQAQHCRRCLPAANAKIIAGVSREDANSIHRRAWAAEERPHRLIEGTDKRTREWQVIE